MTKIFLSCTISVGLAPLANKCGVRAARQLYIYIYIFRSYVVHVPLTRYAQTSDRPVEVQWSI